MMKYIFSEEHRAFIEAMCLPFVVYRFLETTVETLAVSDGFCELFGYQE